MILTHALDWRDARQAAIGVELLNEYARDPMGNGASLPDTVLRTLPDELSRHPGSHSWYATADRIPVGIANAFLGFSTFNARPVLNLHDLAVLPAYRGMGIARILLRAVEQRARELGCVKVTLEVRDDNPRAAELYRKQGYGGSVSDGRPIQYLFLEKRLTM